VFYIYDNTHRSFLPQEFEDKNVALEHLYLICGKFTSLTLIENNKRVRSTGFPIAITKTGNYSNDTFILYDIDKEKTTFGKTQKRWKSYNASYEFNPKIGDLAYFYDGRKAPKIIIGFGTVTYTTYYKPFLRLTTEVEKEKVNTPHKSSYDVIFLKSARGVFSYITSSDIRKIEEM